MPQPVFKLRDRWGNIAQDGSFQIEMRVKGWPAEQPGSMTCAKCIKRDVQDISCVVCYLDSDRGLVTFTDVAVISMGIAWKLTAQLPGMTDLLANSLGFSTAAELRADSAGFDSYGVSSMVFSNQPGPTPSGCPIYPPPTLSLKGYSPFLPSMDQVFVPVAQGYADVFALKCGEGEPDEEVALGGEALAIGYQLSVTNKIVGNLVREVDEAGELILFNGRPTYKGCKTGFKGCASTQSLRIKEEDGMETPVPHNDNYFLYYCNEDTTRAFFGSLGEMPGCGAAFWALSMVQHYCQDGTVGVLDYPTGTSFYQSCDSSVLPNDLINGWSKLTRTSQAAETRAAAELPMGIYDLIFAKVSRPCTMDLSLRGDTTIDMINGDAVFENIILDAPGFYSLRFNLRLYGTTVVQSEDIQYRVVVNDLEAPLILDQPINAAVGETIEIRTRIVDMFGVPVGQQDGAWICSDFSCTTEDNLYKLEATVWKGTPDPDPTDAIFTAYGTLEMLALDSALMGMVNPLNNPGQLFFHFVAAEAYDKVFVKLTVVYEFACGGPPEEKKLYTESIQFKVNTGGPQQLVALTQPPAFLHAGEQFEMSVAALDRFGRMVNQGVDIYIGVHQRSGSWGSHFAPSEQSVHAQCGAPKVSDCQSLEGVDRSLEGTCRPYQPALGQLGMANFTELTFRKAGTYKIYFYLGPPWTVNSSLSSSVTVMSQLMDAWPWYKLRFRPEGMPPVSTQAGDYFRPQPIIELVDQLDNPLDSLRLVLHKLAAASYLRDTDPILVRQQIWAPDDYLMTSPGQFDFSTQGLDKRVQLTTMGLESVYWSADSPMCSEEQIFRITAEVRRQVPCLVGPGVIRIKEMVLDSDPILITPRLPMPEGMHELVKPLEGNALQDFPIQPVVRIQDRYGNPYCVDGTVSVAVHVCPLIRLSPYSDFEVMGECETQVASTSVTYAEAQFGCQAARTACVRVERAGRWRLRYSTSLARDDTGDYEIYGLGSTVVIEPGPVHESLIVQPVNTSVADEPLALVKISLKDASPWKNAATEIVEILASVDCSIPSCSLVGGVSAMSSEGMARFTDLTVVPPASQVHPFECRLIFTCRGKEIGRSNMFTLKVIRHIRLIGSPNEFDGRNVVGEELLAQNASNMNEFRMRVDVLDHEYSLVTESRRVVRASLTSGYGLGCLGRIHHINGIPCSFNDTVLTGQYCTSDEPEGYVCDNHDEESYCAYGVGPNACARCAVPLGSWGGAKDCLNLRVSNGFATFVDLITFESSRDPSVYDHALVFDASASTIPLVVTTNFFWVSWGEPVRMSYLPVSGIAVSGNSTTGLQTTVGHPFAVTVYFKDAFGNRIFYTPPDSVGEGMRFNPGNYIDHMEISDGAFAVLARLGAYEFRITPFKVASLMLNFTIRFDQYGAFEQLILIKMTPDKPHQIEFTSNTTVRGIAGELLQGMPGIVIRDVWGNLVDGTYQATLQGIDDSCNETECPARGFLDSTTANCSQENNTSEVERAMQVCRFGLVPAVFPLDTVLFRESGLYKVRLRVFDLEQSVDIVADSLIMPIAPKLHLQVQDIDDVVAGEPLTHSAGSPGIHLLMLLSEEFDKVATKAPPVAVQLTPVALSVPPTAARRSGAAVLVSESEIYVPGGRACMSMNTVVRSSSSDCHVGEATGPTCEELGSGLCSIAGVSACLECNAEERLRAVLEKVISEPYVCVETAYSVPPSNATCQVPFRVSGRSYHVTRDGMVHQVLATTCVGSNASLAWCGDRARYAKLAQGRALVGASIVNVGTYRLSAVTANFSDEQASSRQENIFFRGLLDYTWVSGLSASFNVTPGEVSGLEKLVDPGDCVLEQIGEAFCEISLSPVVRPVDLYGNGIGDLEVIVDVIQVPLFPEFAVPPERFPGDFDVEMCPAFLNYAEASCPIYTRGGGECTAPTAEELVFICTEAFDPSSSCFSALNSSQGNSSGVAKMCDMMTRVCSVSGLLPVGVSCAGSHDHSNCRSSNAWADMDGRKCADYDQNPSWCGAAASYADSSGADASHACCACSGSSDYICLPGWAEADGSCFIYNSTGASFAEADAACQAMAPLGSGSHLATISSVAMNHAVAQLVGQNSEVFIGLKFIGFGGWSEGLGSLEWVSGMPPPTNSSSYHARWAFGNWTDRVGECTRIFGADSGVHAGAWDDHDCSHAGQGFVCSYVPMVTQMLGGGALRTSKWWQGGTVEFTHLSIESLADSMTPSSSFQPSFPTFAALMRFRLTIPTATFYAGHTVHFVLAKELNLTTARSVLGGELVAGNGLPSFDISLVDFDGGLVKSTDTPIIATLLNGDGDPHPMLGPTSVKVRDRVAAFPGLSVQRANTSLYIRFSYAAQVITKDIYVDTPLFDVFPSSPHHLSVVQQPSVVTAGQAFEMRVQLQDEFGNVCLVDDAKVYAHTCAASDSGCSSVVDAPLFSSMSATRAIARCSGTSCSYESLALARAQARMGDTAGTWHFDLLVIKKAIAGIEIFFGVEEKRTSFPFTPHTWWTPSLTTRSNPLESLRGPLQGFEFVRAPSMAIAGVELPVITIRLTDSEGNDHDPAAPASPAGTPYDTSQVGRVIQVTLQLETAGGRLVNENSSTVMDDSCMRGGILAGNTSFNVTNLVFQVSNLTVFRTGTYKIHLSIDGTDIEGRSNDLDVGSAGADRLLFHTSTSSCEVWEGEEASVTVTLTLTAGAILPLSFQVVDEFGNSIVNPAHCVISSATGSLESRAPWLESLPASKFVSGQTETCAAAGKWLVFTSLRLEYAGSFRLEFRYMMPLCRDCVRTMDVLVTSSSPSHISSSSLPTSFKIDGENLARLSGMCSEAACLHLH